MSTWKIFSDADNNFRWEISDQQLHIEPKEDEPGGAPLLPSMTDLLLQGCLEIMENGEGRFQSPPMFRSGLGKSVAVKQSSLAKALSIIGDEGDAFIDTGQMFNGHKNGFSFSNSMFQTGSGKKVNISSTGLVRAKTLLGLEENYDLHPSSGIEHSKNQSTPFGWQNSSQLKTIVGVTNIHKDAMSHPKNHTTERGQHVKKCGKKSYVDQTQVQNQRECPTWTPVEKSKARVHVNKIKRKGTQRIFNQQPTTTDMRITCSLSNTIHQNDDQNPIQQYPF